MDPRPAHVVARFLTAARPIKIDKPAIKRLLDSDVIPQIKRWCADHPWPDEPIGRESSIANAVMQIQPVGNAPETTVSIDIDAKQAATKDRAVAGGSAQEPSHERGRALVQITMHLNGALTPNELLTRMDPCSDWSCIPYGLYSILIHEVTHAMELHFLRGPAYSRDHEGPTDQHEYMNAPIELRAFMQQIVDEVVMWAARRPIRLKAKGSNQRLITETLKLSKTWARIQGALTRTNRNKILSAVHDALARESLLFE